MPVIRIPEEHWWKVWRFLIEHGPISRISQDPIYVVSKRQVRLLRTKKMPFEEIKAINGPPRSKAGCVQRDTSAATHKHARTQ